MATIRGVSFLQRIFLAASCSIALAILGGMPASAQEDGDSRTTRIVVRNLDLHPRTPQEMGRTIARLSEAAMQACGAAPFSYGENRVAIAASPCWHDAMNAATALIQPPPSRIADANTP